MSRKEQKARTREALKQAAVDLLRDGATELRVADVTARTEVAHGTFYVHFPHLDDLIDELLADFDRDLIATVVQELPAEVAALDELLTAIAFSYFGHWRAHRGHLSLYARRLLDTNPPARASWGLNQTAHGWLNRAAAAVRELTGADPEEVVVLFQAVLASWQRLGLAVVHERVGADLAARILARLTVSVVQDALPAVASMPPGVILEVLRSAGQQLPAD